MPRADLSLDIMILSPLYAALAALLSPTTGMIFSWL